MAKFRVAFLCIKAWAMARGLYGAKYGLLGGIHITVMLTPICKSLATYSKPVSTSDIVTTFFHHYSTFDWATQLVLDPFFHKDLKYHRTVREPMCLLGWHAPALNTALAASVPTVKTIAMEITHANSLLSAPTASWDTLLDAKAVSQGPKDFLTAYKSYVKVDARFWGASPSQGRRFLGWLESRCVAVLVDIDRKANALLPRIWPARFTDKQAQDESEYHGFYLIGLSWHDASISRDDAKDAESALQTVLQNFESRMRSDERYYDASSSWLSASIVKASDLRDAVLDPNVYAGDYGDSGSDDDSDEEEEEEEIDEDDDDSESNLRSSSKREKKCLAARGPKPPGMGKFRSAADAMNRIRWDMGIDDSDYIIGFEDRFTGAMEKSLSLWKTEQTDEEFIPQHRILYFKKKSDGEIMWERRTRIDKLFNSGISTAR
ncbi:hypothetical protein Golomagni_06981 [Golovinomyces magnicellulatus]|nr:hypothetical protein Golomagni_06981 [Golovinomyces magnicellulatus]